MALVLCTPYSWSGDDIMDHINRCLADAKFSEPQKTMNALLPVLFYAHNACLLPTVYLYDHLASSAGPPCFVFCRCVQARPIIA